MAKPKPKAAGGGGKKKGNQGVGALAPAPKKRRYAYRDGFSCPVPAQVAGERIATLQEQNGGTVTLRQVADDARPEDADLHPGFEWRDEVAADRFRVEVQARSIVTSIRVIAYDENTNREYKIPENVHVDYEHVGSCYVTAETAFAREDLTDQVLAEARRAYLGLMARFDHLSQLARLHAAIRDHLLEG